MVNKILVLLTISIVIVLAVGCTENTEKTPVNDSKTGKNITPAGTGTNDTKTGGTLSNPPEFVSLEEVIRLCISECKSRKDTEDLSRGPCLSNEIAPDWVCDVAHNPREAVDNKPENQCSAYGEGKAHHFIEVAANCTIINVN
jgi:hypothetical protein